MQDKKLVKAHIIPKSLYAPLRVDTRPPEIHSNAQGVYPKKSPVGEYDDSILCGDCERRFGGWDDYAQSLMLADVKDEDYIVGGGKQLAFVIRNIDYAKFKLFFVSLLWRASVSARPFFSRVRTGPFEIHLREMILNNDPGDQSVFAVTLAKFDDSSLGTAMLDPHPEKWFGINYCRFYMAGFVAYIKVDSRSPPNFMNDFVLRPSGSLIVILRDLWRSNELPLMQKIAQDVVVKLGPR